MSVPPPRVSGPPLKAQADPESPHAPQSPPARSADHSGTLTDLLENVYGLSVNRREPGDRKDSTQFRSYKPLTSITVSKKRNWLYQSTLKSLHVGEESRRCQDANPLPSSPVSPPAHQLPRPFLRSSGEYCTSEVCNTMDPLLPRKCPVDFSEENDADDEGEIWYNPIPEDEDSGTAHHSSLGKAGPAVPKHPTANVPSNNPGGKAEQDAEDSEHISGQTGDTQRLRSSDSSPVRPLPCTDGLKQRLGHQPQEGPVEDSFTSAGPGTLAPPSKNGSGITERNSPSPSLVKMGSSMGWSLPDKIKSPRTVRKLSMKMKRLPELSRKLSVKGALSCSPHPDNTHSLSKRECGVTPRMGVLSSGDTATAAKRNVISRYHLDSSVSSQHSLQKKPPPNPKLPGRGGYLSDGDSPEPGPQSGKRGWESRSGKGREAAPGSGKQDLDSDAFRHYSFSEQPRCAQFLSGHLSVHLYGAEDLKPPRLDSRDVFCALQIDSVNKARTALLTCRTAFLDMDHTFNIEIEKAQRLKLVVFSWEPAPKRNRVCCQGTVLLPTLFRAARTQQLAVRLKPRGLIYVKVTLLEQWENSLLGLDLDREPVVFGVDIRTVVQRENTGSLVPLLIQKCIVEIERRGCQVVGLYRLCGSAAVKKELREAFERDSKAVGLCENQYPDINVITGVLKDYLRELPSPLITKHLYKAVLDVMMKNPLKMSSSGCENDPSDSSSAIGLLQCLPDVEKATLKMLLDHLKLVASYHKVNKMTCKNLAVCFGPVLLSQGQETLCHSNRVFTDTEELASALDFKKHIEVLHYLLQLWPVQPLPAKESTDNWFPEQKSPLNYLRQKKERPSMLNLSGTDFSRVLRPRQARLDSPLSNRYAGDWSSCGENYFVQPQENSHDGDGDDILSEDRGGGDRVYEPSVVIGQPPPVSEKCLCQPYLTVQTIESANGKVNLQDLQESIDTLIGNLERELNKNKLNLGD